MRQTNTKGLYVKTCENGKSYLVVVEGVYHHFIPIETTKYLGTFYKEQETERKK